MIPEVKKVQSCHRLQHSELVDQQSEDHHDPVDASVDFEHVAFISNLQEQRNIAEIISNHSTDPDREIKWINTEVLIRVFDFPPHHYFISLVFDSSRKRNEIKRCSDFNLEHQHDVSKPD